MTHSSSVAARDAGHADRSPPCPGCGRPVSGPTYREIKVCDACGFHGRRTARETIDHLVDPGTFFENAAPSVSRPLLVFGDARP